MRITTIMIVFHGILLLRYLDKLVDELAKGKTMDQILRK